MRFIGKYIFALALGSACAAAVSAECPAIPPAQRTLFISGETYATTNGFSLREDGIVLFDYGKAFNNLGKWADPYFNTNYALALYRDYLDTQCKDEKLRKKFLRVADWMIQEGKARGEMLVWEYPFSDPNFQLDPGWVSGIGQSRMAGVLVRAHAMTGEQKYQDAAKKAMAAYEHPISEGGVMTFDGDVAWIEEMADPKGNSFKVLNGHVTGLAGIMDYYAVTREQKWKALIAKTVAAVKRDVHLFDAGFSSYYSLKMPSTERPIAPRLEYNAHHVGQLIWMYEEFKDPTFLEWAMRFHAYDANQDKYSASNSIDPVAHGPEGVKALYGDHYWSTGTFPADLIINMPAADRVKGVAIDANLMIERPVNFSVTAWKNGTKVAEKIITNNQLRHLDIMFPQPIEADKVIATFEDTSGKDVLAIKMMMILRDVPHYGAVMNECNATFRRIIPHPVLGFAGGSPVAPRCDGWIILPREFAEAKLYIDAAQDGKGDFKASYSDDLLTWTPAGTIPAHGGDLDLNAGKFVRLDFKTTVGATSKIWLGNPTVQTAHR
ncbi:D-glucuronyl C5-epimerase family protein [Achromobacter spanius]|uniref:D-glucuronyl C5-epimerase C-terminal domain-containing protein n=1 Tax=Achromobacter spanius TaxID=217203 RepID=A0AAW3I8E4_9BURK|nr:D-glucuronyl C5-epimerase family protein [Achromobacter spanius]KNE28170.1 hypothetical protein AFM18_08370 [Achromobacter spanius]